MTYTNFALFIMLIISHAVAFSFGRYLGKTDERMIDWANSTDPKHKDFDQKGGLHG